MDPVGVYVQGWNSFRIPNGLAPAHLQRAVMYRSFREEHTQSCKPHADGNFQAAAAVDMAQQAIIGNPSTNRFPEGGMDEPRTKTHRKAKQTAVGISSKDDAVRASRVRARRMFGPWSARLQHQYVRVPDVVSWLGRAF